LNKADFISLIEQPDSLGKNHIPALKNIAVDFPYFQSAQLLLTKALYNEKHYEFEKQLKYASLMLPDRAVFFRYIHNMTEAAIQQAVPVEIPEPEIEPIAEEHPIEDKIIPEVIIPEVEPIVLVAEPEIIEPVIEAKIEVIADIIEIEPEPIELTPVPEAEPIPEVTAADPNETHSFAEWLKMQADHTYKPVEAPEIPLVEAQAVLPEEQKEETPDLSMQEQIAGQVERSSNVTEFESILDKFIRENPRITRGKAEFYSPMNMAKQSVEQDEELVSETLANIYYKQGHFKKAIRIYEKLCLLYPHKLPYFADLIQKIKTENKD
jgi:tetratricopeptide (TPR) repeat protein